MCNVCVCVYVCLSVCVCEVRHFCSKNLNVNEIDTILKTHKYKQSKKNSLYCESQSTLCMREKEQNVKIFKYKYEGSKLNHVVRTAT